MPRASGPCSRAGTWPRPSPKRSPAASRMARRPLGGRTSNGAAGVISRVDIDNQRLHVSLTKEDIKDAPEFDELTYRHDAYRHDLADYYALRARGYRE